MNKRLLMSPEHPTIEDQGLFFEENGWREDIDNRTWPIYEREFNRALCRGIKVCDDAELELIQLSEEGDDDAYNKLYSKVIDDAVSAIEG